MTLLGLQDVVFVLMDDYWHNVVTGYREHRKNLKAQETFDVYSFIHISKLAALNDAIYNTSINTLMNLKYYIHRVIKEHYKQVETHKGTCSLDMMITNGRLLSYNRKGYMYSFT